MSLTREQLIDAVLQLEGSTRADEGEPPKGDTERDEEERRRALERLEVAIATEGRNLAAVAARLSRELQEARAERDAARLEMAEWQARAHELEYAAGYAADLAAIDRVLDQCDAPHDCEDGVSLSPKRIRLLAEQRDAARLELRALEWILTERVCGEDWSWSLNGGCRVETYDGDGAVVEHDTYASAARAMGWEG